MNLIQIGCAGLALKDIETNQATKLFKEESNQVIHLIDANPFALKEFQNNCKTLSYYSKMRFYNFAVLPIDTHFPVKFFSPRDPSKSDFSSINPNHVAAHLHNTDMDVLNIDSVSLNSFIQKFVKGDISHLIIDTEGLDAQLLFSLNFEQIKPKNIVFEHLHTDGIAQKHIRFNLIINLLTHYKYSIKDWDWYSLIATLT